MSRILPATLLIISLVTACGPSSRYSASRQTGPAAKNAEEQVDDSGNTTFSAIMDIETLLADRSPESLLNLPVSEKGEIVLSEGYHEAEFKSYCLQPGTPDPTDRDAYLQMPLAGPRREILETVLRNSLDKPHLEQKNIQLLLWSIVSRSDYDRLAPSVKRTATQLLTQRQIFELKGGVMGLVKTVATMIPESGLGNSYNQVRNLFELGSSSYEAYERIAVLRQPSVIHSPDYKKEQWHRHRDGYYVRYFPKGYQVVKVQVFVPAGTLDSAGLADGRYLLFDPVSTMAVPANSNAQRLGVGAPVVDVIRTIIQIHNSTENRKSQPGEKPVTPPSSSGKGIGTK